MLTHVLLLICRLKFLSGATVNRFLFIETMTLYDVCTRERVFVVPCGHHHDSDQYVDMYNETDVVSKGLCNKISSTEVEYSVDTYGLL